MFDNLSELATVLSDGFFMDDVVSLFQKNNYSIDTVGLKLLDRVKDYFKLAKQGYNFYANYVYPKDNVNNVLNAFKNITYVLVNYFNKPDLKKDDFLSELQVFENEIKLIVIEKKIIQNKVENSLMLFKTIGKMLLGELDNF